MADQSAIPPEIRTKVEGIFDSFGFDRGLLFGAICAAIATEKARANSYIEACDLYEADLATEREAREKAEKERDHMVRGLSALVHCQSPLARSSMRSAAADLLAALNLKPSDLGGDQSPFVTRAEAAEASLAEAKRLLRPFGVDNDLPTNLPDDTRLIITFAGQIVAHAKFGDFRDAARFLAQESNDG